MGCNISQTKFQKKLHLRRAGRDQPDDQPSLPAGMAPTLEPVISKLEKFILYETASYLYIVGCDKRQLEYRVLKLDRKVLRWREEEYAHHYVLRLAVLRGHACAHSGSSRARAREGTRWASSMKSTMAAAPRTVYQDRAH